MLEDVGILPNQALFSKDNFITHQGRLTDYEHSSGELPGRAPCLSPV
jgi:hypothetical protein